MTSMIKVDEIQNSAGTTTLAKFENGQLTGALSPATGFRNRIINGDMRIDQRNAGAAVTVNGYTVDRFSIFNNTDGAFSIQQDSSAPNGFAHSLKATATTADGTLTTTQHLVITQSIEGFNVSDLGWGTANAQPVTLSFWVRSSLTGTFGGSLRSSGGGRSYPFTYSISVVDTWEKKSITISGDTTGTWLTTNGIGIQIGFSLGAGPDRSGPVDAWASANYTSATGAVSVIGTLNATWQITGVQLEAGTVATPFEFRSIGQELGLCQRYLPAFNATTTTGPLPGSATALTTNAVLIFNHPVPARVQGTGVVVSANTHFNFSNNDGNSSSTAVSFAAGSPDATQISITVAVSRGATTTPGWIYANNVDAKLFITGCEL